MSFLYRLERNFDKLGISNITMYLIGGQVLAYVLIYLRPDLYSLMNLQGSAVLQGQYWRLITFVFTPFDPNPLFMILMGYTFYLFGTALEHKWGSFRYFLYLAINFILTLVAAFIFPFSSFTNGYLFGSIFLAFAYLFPNMRIYIFFIIPVKVKWLGILAWIGIVFALITGSLADKIVTLIAIANFFIFFGKDLLLTGKYRYRGVSRTSARAFSSAKPYHICAVCGDNEIKNPHMEIRYCRKCVPESCYCGKHIHNHEHLMN